MPPELKKILTHCRNLPSPPGIALRVIEMAQDPDLDLATVADVISMDMALSARVLRAANSPLYGNRRNARNLEQALATMGLNASVSLALGFSVTHGLRNSFAPHKLHERIWQRSILTALSARELGHAINSGKTEELMLAGLLQDIGILALLHSAEADYAPLLEQATDNAALIAAERDAFGCDHAEAGAWLARHWQLPSYLVNAIANSESTDTGNDQFLTCVTLSGTVADIWLGPDQDAAKNSALTLTQEHLKLDAEHLATTLNRIAAALPKTAALFDVRLQQPQQLESLLDHAHEVATLRSMIEMHKIACAQRHNDELENRARHLSEQASRDALTGVYNRYQLSATLEQEFELAHRHGWPLSIAFIDLDDFKGINDAHGHLTGDEVLCKFAHTLQSMVRSSDTIARYGGEEFLVILPDTDKATAQRVIERVLDNIARTPMAQLPDGPLNITFSAGLATHSENCRFDNALALIKAADDVLYHSKHLGRNRVTAHTPTPPANVGTNTTSEQIQPL